MKTLYIIKRGIVSLFSNAINKILMTVSGIQYGKNFRSCGTILYRRYGGEMIIGNNVSVNSHLIADPIGGQTKTILCVCEGAKLIIGNNVGISNAAFFAQKEVIVDDEAVIGAGVKIYDTDFHSSVAEYRMKGNTHVKTKPVRIGKRAFIGGHSIILKGVSIGEEAVVGAGSVVAHDIPAREIWAGNPAKCIKKLSKDA